MSTACYDVPVYATNQIWQTDNILYKSLPTLAIQMAFTTIMSRFFFFLYKPFHQSQLVAQISVGIFLTQVLWKFNIFGFIFPANGVINIDVLTITGIVYYAFVTGLEMNLDTILHVKKKAATIAISGFIFPMVMGPGLYILHRKVYSNGEKYPLEESKMNAYVIWTLVLTVTGFPVVVHALTELKLVYTRLGKIALTTAMISDTYAWILFTLVVPFSINGTRGIYSVLSTIIFVFICIYMIRPIIVKIIDREIEKDEWDDNRLLLFLVMGIFIFAYITDTLGTHGIVGAFVYGLILPHGKFADMVISVTDDFGGAFLVPLYFGGSGMRLSLSIVFNQPNWPLSLMVIILLCVPKILSTLFATFFFGIHARDGFALGIILNTKGAVALMMLNTAWDKSIISVPTYSVLTLGVLLMTIIVPPIINIIYKSRKHFEQNKLKTIQMLRLDAGLRILACVHNTRQATGIISLIESFNATRLSPIHVFSLYLVELTGRAGALVASYLEKPDGQIGAQNLTRSQEELESINNTFEAFGEANDAVRIQTLNVVSAYATIHKDIFNSANEKHTSLIILPFHKQLNSEGALKPTSIAYKDINLNVMQGAPCSVGIFVDRDIGPLPKLNFCICMIFVGGPDDREALAIAWRMAGHPGTRLSVVRMLLFDKAAEVDTLSHDETQGILSVVMDNEKQKDLDDEYVNSFRLIGVHNNDSISYSEVDVHSGEDIPTIINELEKFGFNLYIVGQGNSRNSKVFSNLLEWCDCSELGVIGDMLASENFGLRSSVLVVQQYGYGGMVSGKQSNQVTANNNGLQELVVKTE